MSSIKNEAPLLQFDAVEMEKWGYIWRIGAKVDNSTPALTALEAGLPVDWADIVDEASKAPSAFNKKQGMDFGLVFDRAVGHALSDMLGDVPVVDYARLNASKKKVEAAKKALRLLSKQGGALVEQDAPALEAEPEIRWTTNELLPPHSNCIEVGPVRVIGGIRPQNFDVAYRPDGPRIVYDSKTLNDAKSIPKNWQNMVNDLGTEATTVHTRFPYAIVAFVVAVPSPAIRQTQLLDLIRTLERLATRNSVLDQEHLAESIAFIVWNPDTGNVDTGRVPSDSPIHVSNFMQKIHRCYVERYKGLPPHDHSEPPVEAQT